MPTWVRYAMFQIPGTIAVGIAVYWGSATGWISGTTAVVAFTLWILKDAALYPMTRSAYEAKTAPPGRPVGKVGVVRQELHPEGTIRVQGAIWNAKASADRGPIGSGVKVRVVDAEGLLLIVEPEDRNDE